MSPEPLGVIVTVNCPVESGAMLTVAAPGTGIVTGTPATNPAPCRVIELPQYTIWHGDPPHVAEPAEAVLAVESQKSSDVPGGRKVDIEETITRDDADAAWAGLLERMRSPILRALGDARANTQDIDEVLLVGGATRMPCVAQLAAQLFGRLPSRSLPPDEAVALGAAVQAALKANDAAVEDLVVTDVAPFTMGIDVQSRLGNTRMNGVFEPIIERGTVIPASRVKTFSTTESLQSRIRLRVYQGEHSLCRDNHLLGELEIKDIPLSTYSQPVDVRFTYDLNGILEVEARVHATGVTTSEVIQEMPGRLSGEEIAAARAAMTRLKLHPRDALPNTTALARAEALYVELSGPARDELGRTMNLFRAALEEQDPARIEPLRERIVAIVRALRSEADR
jgi:molecular chaperone HscC